MSWGEMKKNRINMNEKLHFIKKVNKMKMFVFDIKIYHIQFNLKKKRKSFISVVNVRVI